MNPETKDLSDTVKTSWQQFLEVYEPLRPDLYRYCRYLTRSPWDAEDLAQDALARAFVTLAQMHHDYPASPRAWLFRVASNLWIDRTRRREPPAAAPDAPSHTEPQASREAAGTLIARLSPQERAAVVLKDVFDFSLEEIAESLTTTPGAIKAALHRGRGKLAEPESPEERLPLPAVLDAFVAAFNAHDLDRLVALLTDTASLEVVGATEEYGPDAARTGPLWGMLFGSRRMAEADGRGELGPSGREGLLPDLPRVELRIHRGEPILLHYYRHEDGERVRAVTRVLADGDRIARVRNYFFTPDFLEDVCKELGLPFATNGYRYWGRFNS